MRPPVPEIASPEGLQRGRSKQSSYVLSGVLSTPGQRLPALHWSRATISTLAPAAFDRMMQTHDG